MRRRWSVILPIYGLMLFGVITTQSVKYAHERHPAFDDRYFRWGTLRLDPDPRNKYMKTGVCGNSEPNCVAWDPRTMLTKPGPYEKLLILTAFPAFIATALPMLVTTKLGISQIPVFFTSMPVFIFAWFYLVGWLIDRRRYKRVLKKTTGAASQTPIG